MSAAPPVLSERDLCGLAGARAPEQVYELVLKSKELTALPPAISRLKKLRALDANNNRIGKVDIALLRSVGDLRELRLASNKLTMLPDMRHNTRLENLYLQGNSIRDFSNVLLKCRALKTLWVSNNQLEGKLDTVLLPSSVQSLDLSHNRLEHVIVRKLKKLEALLLTDNKLVDAPDISSCPLLDELDLSRNNLARCDTLGNKQSLAKHSISVMRLNSNRISRLKDLPRLKELSELELAGNRVKTIANIAKAFPALEVLDVSDNVLTELNATIEAVSELEFLVELVLQDNPCCEGMSRTAYRQMVCSRLPGLEFLDGVAVADKDRSLQHSAPFEAKHAALPSSSSPSYSSSSSSVAAAAAVPRARPQSARAGGRAAVPLVRPSTAKSRGDTDAKQLEKRIASLLQERTESIKDTKHKFSRVLSECHQALQELGGGPKSERKHHSNPTTSSQRGNKTPPRTPRGQNDSLSKPKSRARPQSARRPSSAHSRRSKLTAAKQFSTIVYRGDADGSAVQAALRASPSPPVRASLSENKNKQLSRSSSSYSSQATVKRTAAVMQEKEAAVVKAATHVSGRRAPARTPRAKALRKKAAQGSVPALLRRAQNYDSNSSGSDGDGDLPGWRQVQPAVVRSPEPAPSPSPKQQQQRQHERPALYGITASSSDEDEGGGDQAAEAAALSVFAEQRQVNKFSTATSTPIAATAVAAVAPVLTQIDLSAAVQHQEQEAREDDQELKPVETDAEMKAKIDMGLKKVRGDAVMFARPSSARRSARRATAPTRSSTATPSSSIMSSSPSSSRARPMSGKTINTTKVSVKRAPSKQQHKPSIRRTGGNPFLKKKKKQNAVAAK
jgi:hypothetical protein